jgi:3'-phosphoadenosine 5'-phosphosulfate (PAPS) 3'-phosphatase
LPPERDEEGRFPGHPEKVTQMSVRGSPTSFSCRNQNCLQDNRLSVHDPGMSKSYIAQRGDDYFAVVEENGKIVQETRITDAKVVEEIEKLLAERRKAGQKITELLREKGPLSGSVHFQATVALGEGDESEPA